jgi:hypothetical protein
MHYYHVSIKRYMILSYSALCAVPFFCIQQVYGIDGRWQAMLAFSPSYSRINRNSLEYNLWVLQSRL